MPELSQDNFEVLNPVNSPLTPEILRARANSFGNNGNATNAGTGAVRKQKKVSIAGLGPFLPDSPDEEFRARAFTASDMDQSIINGAGVDQYKGYKREMDHRYFMILMKFIFPFRRLSTRHWNANAFFVSSFFLYFYSV